MPNPGRSPLAARGSGGVHTGQLCRRGGSSIGVGLLPVTQAVSTSFRVCGTEFGSYWQMLFRHQYAIFRVCFHRVRVRPDITSRPANGRYFTYRSIDKESWPPSMNEIVSDIPLSNQPRSNLSSKMYTLCQKKSASAGYRRSGPELWYI